jgi:hypothetical protein
VSQRPLEDGDLDYAISKRDRKGVLELFPSLGYEANERFNLMQGDQLGRRADRFQLHRAHGGG